jgi:hypothetical protein
MAINPDHFSDIDEWKGFFKKIKENQDFCEELLILLQEIRNVPVDLKVDSEKSYSKYLPKDKEYLKQLRESRMIPFKNYLEGKFGKFTAVFLVEGLSKRFYREEINWYGAKQYQKELFEKFGSSKF